MFTKKRILLPTTLGIFALLLFTLPIFQVNKISYKPTSFISPEQLTLFNNTLIQKNIFRLTLLNQLEKQLKHTFPSILGIQIKLNKFPNLSVSITEKKPWVAFITKDKSLLVAEDGTILTNQNVSLSEELSNILIVKGFSETLFNTQTINQETIEKIKSILSFLNKRFTNQSLQLIYNQGEWELILNDSLPIYIGKLTNLNEKFELITTFINRSSFNQNNLAYIDARYSSKIIVKEK